MENQDIVDLDYSANTGGSRTTFITVLCVLSWVFIGFALLIHLRMSFTTDLEGNQFLAEIESEIAKDKNIGEQESVMILDFFAGYIVNIGKYSFAKILALLFELAGVIMIFRMKKVGFWIYLGSIVLYYLPAFMYLSMSNPVTQSFLMFFALPTVLFLVLYAVNVKHLK